MNAVLILNLDILKLKQMKSISNSSSEELYVSFEAMLL